MASRGYPTTTESTRERELITGGDPDAPFAVPVLFSDFRDAPELARIGNALIQSCEEFEDLKWAIAEDGFEIAYVWKKKASKSADKFVAGKQGKPGGLAKHFASEAKGATVGYTVVLAADANYGQTNWQIEALVFHELYHCKIGRKTVGKGEDKRTVPVLKVKAHDLEMFWAERRRYGDWHSALERGTVEFAQAKLPMERPPKLKSEPNKPTDDTHDPKTGLPRAGFWTERERRVRENFPVEFADGATSCRACGVSIAAHDPELCQGGTPQTRQDAREKSPKNRGEAKGAVSEESPKIDESPVLDDLSASEGQSPNGNGSHDAELSSRNAPAATAR